MTVILTTEQARVIEVLMQPGHTLLGKIEREPFDNTNVGTCGRLRLELGSVPTSSLPALREAIKAAITGTPKKKKRAQKSES